MLFVQPPDAMDVMCEQFDFLMQHPDDPRFPELRALLLEPFEEKKTAKAGS